MAHMESMIILPRSRVIVEGGKMHACTQGEGRKRSRHGVQGQSWEPWAERQTLLEHFAEMQGLNTIKQYRLQRTL